VNDSEREKVDASVTLLHQNAELDFCVQWRPATPPLTGCTGI